MTDEYLVKIAIRNNLLMTAIRNAGYTNLQSFAEACGINLHSVRGLTTLIVPPINSAGEFTNAAKAIMETLGAAPCDLWTEAQLTMALKTSSTTRTVSETYLQYFLESHLENMLLPNPEDELMRKQGALVADKLLDTLTPREASVLRRRLAGEHLRDIGDSDGVSANRTMQIEAKALRKLRHPTRIVPFLDALNMPVTKQQREASSR